jgi:hypothetical protein
MPEYGTGNPREDSERRIQRRFEREARDLAEWQRRQEEHDRQAHERTMTRIAARQESLAEEKRKVLERHDEDWRKMQQSLGHKTQRIPVFRLGGGERSVNKDYERLHKQWQDGRDRINEEFDRRMTERDQQRALLQTEFNERAQRQKDDDRKARDDLASRQQQSFEREVAKDLERQDNSLGRTFDRHGRETGPRER